MSKLTAAILKMQQIDPEFDLSDPPTELVKDRQGFKFYITPNFWLFQN